MHFLNVLLKNKNNTHSVTMVIQKSCCYFAIRVMLKGVGKFFTHRTEVMCKGGVEHQLSLCHRTSE